MSFCTPKNFGLSLGNSMVLLTHGFFFRISSIVGSSLFQERVMVAWKNNQRIDWIIRDVFRIFR